MKETKPCERCGALFERNRNYNNKVWAKARFCGGRCAGLRSAIDEKQIVEMYLGGKSSTQVAAIVNVHTNTVARIIRERGLTRSPSDYQKLSHARPDVKAKLSAARKGKRCAEHVKEILRGRVGDKNHNWRGGLSLGVNGYLTFTASPANGDNAGRLLHQVIAEWKIGRPLAKGEVVHHKDRNKLNNDPDNLEVMSHSDHARHHALENGLGRNKQCRLEA